MSDATYTWTVKVKLPEHIMDRAQALVAIQPVIATAIENFTARNVPVEYVELLDDGHPQPERKKPGRKPGRKPTTVADHQVAA